MWVTSSTRTGPRLAENAVEVDPVGTDQAVAEQVQAQVGVLGVSGSRVEINDHAHHLGSHLAQVVGELCRQQRGGGLLGDIAADPRLRVEHVEDGTGVVNGGEAPAPALAKHVSHAGQCSERTRQRHPARAFTRGRPDGWSGHLRCDGESPGHEHRWLFVAVGSQPCFSIPVLIS